jgi:hypothetical protein
MVWLAQWAVPGIVRALPVPLGILGTVPGITNALPGNPLRPGNGIRGPLIAAPLHRTIRLWLFAAHVPVRRPCIVLTRHARPAQILLVLRPSAAHEPSHP